jgi:hypothetical protein
MMMMMMLLSNAKGWSEDLIPPSVGCPSSRHVGMRMRLECASNGSSGADLEVAGGGMNGRKCSAKE